MAAECINARRVSRMERLIEKYSTINETWIDLFHGRRVDHYL
jgi:hypothetical protein